MNALELLRNDHVAVRGLLEDLEQMADAESDPTLRAMVALIEREVKTHSELEETIFYPAFRKATARGGDESLSTEAVEEHHQVDKRLPALKLLVPRRDAFAERVRAVDALVERHIDMEEQQMFARAREMFEPAELDELGRRITRRKQELYVSWTGVLTAPLRKAKSLVEMVTPLAFKRAKVARHARRMQPLVAH